MRDEVSEEQIASYRKNGFIVLEGFLDGDELDTWRRVTDEAVADRLATSVDYLTNQNKPNEFYSKVFTQCVRLADTCASMRELIYDERIARMGALLAGIQGIRVWHDQALYKPPFGNPTAWHLDNPYWSFHSRDALSVWIALDDATLTNGCLFYIPGSHKTATFDNVGIGQNTGALFEVYPEWRQVDPEAGDCPAGSAVWHNGLTAHGAGANMTRHQRRAMTCAYMPDGSTFNGQKNVLPQDYFSSLKAGDTLDNEDQNPLLWHAADDA